MELICKFYAKQPSDKKKCLLRDVAITDNGEILITDSRNKNIKVRATAFTDATCAVNIASLNGLEDKIVEHEPIGEHRKSNSRACD